MNEHVCMANKIYHLKNLLWLELAFFVIIFDQVSKYIVSHTMEWGESIPLLPFFNLTLLHNQGAAFSFLGRESGWQRWFFASIAMVVGIGLVIWLIKLPEKARWQKASLALILGGALGNLWDRLTLGYVVDFLHLYIGKFDWPVFNFADTAIVLGAAMLTIHFLFNSSEKNS